MPVQGIAISPGQLQVVKPSPRHEPRIRLQSASLRIVCVQALDRVNIFKQFGQAERRHRLPVYRWWDSTENDHRRVLGLRHATPSCSATANTVSNRSAMAATANVFSAYAIDRKPISSRRAGT